MMRDARTDCSKRDRPQNKDESCMCRSEVDTMMNVQHVDARTNNDQSDFKS